MTQAIIAQPSQFPRWASLLPWAALTWVELGERYTNVGGIYVATTGGKTGNSGGPTGTGTGITDGSVVWSYVGQLAPPWTNNGGAGETWSVGVQVTANGNVYYCAVGGLGATSGTGPSGTGPGLIIDGAAGWLYMASANAQIAYPSDGQKDIGWVPGYKPPAQTENWRSWLVYRWIVFLWGMVTPNCVKSSSCGTASTSVSSATPVAVTNLSVSPYLTGLRPVLLMCQNDDSGGSGGAWGYPGTGGVAVQINWTGPGATSGTIALSQAGGGSNPAGYAPPSLLQTMFVPTSGQGSYTFTAYFGVAGTGTVTAYAMVLVATEI